MATFAEYILNEPDFIKKIDIMTYLKKKQNIFFNTSVIMKAEIAREFMDTMKLDVDQGLVLTACLMYDCLKIDSPEELVRFCKICAEHSRVGQDSSITREKESDILELADQFGGLIMHRSDRIAYTVPEALEILVNKNMKDCNNVYLNTFQEFVDIMEGIEV